MDSGRWKDADTWDRLTGREDGFSEKEEQHNHGSQNITSQDVNIPPRHLRNIHYLYNFLRASHLATIMNNTRGLQIWSLSSWSIPEGLFRESSATKSLAYPTSLEGCKSDHHPGRLPRTYLGNKAPRNLRARKLDRSAYSAYPSLIAKNKLEG
jgi:hypothetical protein